MYSLINIVFQILYLCLIARVVLSLIPHNPTHPVVQIINKITDPLLKPFRDLVPTTNIGFDLSPIFAFIALIIIKTILIWVLFQ